MRTKFFMSALVLSCLLFVASTAKTGWAQEPKEQDIQKQQQQQKMDQNRQNNQDDQDINRTDTDLNKTDTDRTDMKDVKANDNLPEIDKKGDDTVTPQEKTDQQIDTGQQ